MAKTKSAASPSASPASLDWATLYPGESVPLPGHPGKTMSVYPLALPHLRQFTSQICELIATVKTVEIPKGADRAEVVQAFLAALGPGAIDRLFGLLDACCVPSIKGAPIPVVMAAARAWIGQLLASEEAHPFFVAMGGMVRAAVLERLLALSRASISSSPTATASPTSSAPAPAAASASTAIPSPT